MPKKELKRPILQYRREAVQHALSAIRNDNITIREASRRFGVPRGTLQDRIHGRVSEDSIKMGRDTVLTIEEEQKLVDWCIMLTKCGFPRKKDDLLNTVKAIMVGDKRENPFVNDRPGRKWYNLFLKRHPELTHRTVEGLSKGRAVITEESIRKWFRELDEYLHSIGAEDIRKDPTRILNGDETSFSICPKSGKVIAPKGWKNVYEVQNGNEKETITVLLVFNADGDTIPPMVVFPYVRPPKDVIKSIPHDWFMGRSETGWMKSETFYEYIVNGVNTWLINKEIKKPVLLLIDGHKSHLTLELSTYCSQNGIILYALPPNTTHMMQPADVSVFKPLKSEWKKTVRDWQNKPDNLNCVLTKSAFCPLLATALENKDMKQTIKNGFRKCGLYPFNPDAVDYSKCVQNTIENLRKDENEQPILFKTRDFEIAKHVILSLEKQLIENGINVETVINEIEKANQKVTIQLNTVTLSETEIDIVPGDYFVTPNGRLEILQADAESNLNININKSPCISPKIVENAEDQELLIEAIDDESFRMFEINIPGTSKNMPDKSTKLPLTSKNSKDLNKENLPNVVNIKKRSSTFESHLFFPTRIGPKTKKPRTKEVLPSAISSVAWQNFMNEKERKKNEETIAKEKRKEERNIKKMKKAKINAKKLREKKPKKQVSSRYQLSSSSDEECIVLNDKICCSECQDELVSDVEEDNLKNIGCDNCPRWYHLKCSSLRDITYEEAMNCDFTCHICS